MSIPLLRKAWKTHCNSAGEKAVLVWLSDHAHEDGLSWPSIETLCEECSMSERTAQGHLLELERRGLLRIERRGGRHRTNRYFVLQNPAESAPFPEKPRRNNTVIPARNPADFAENPADFAPQSKGILKESKGGGNGAPHFPNEIKDQIHEISEEIQRLTDFARTEEDKLERSRLIARRKELRQKYYYA